MKSRWIVFAVIIVALVVIGIVFKQKNPQNSSDIKEWSTYTDSKIGFEFKYPPDKLTPVPADLRLHAGKEYDTKVLKLVHKENALKYGKERCIYGESGESEICNPEHDFGLGFGEINAPFLTINAGLEDPLKKEITIVGIKGVLYQIGAEGSGVDYYVFPYKGKTFLIADHYHTEYDANTLEGTRYISPQTVEEIIKTFKLIN